MLNSCLGLVSAAASLRRPFSRSYGAILPSSLAMLLPSALGFSPHPPVSVYGTGPYTAIAAFLGACSAAFPTLSFGPHHTSASGRGLSSSPLGCLHRALLSRLLLCLRVPAVLCIRGTGISTCCPSATPPGLALGPDLPRADQLYPGILGFSAGRIPTSLSLLIPAFSLPNAPPPLTGRLPRVGNAPLPVHSCTPKLRRRVSAPDIFGAGPLD